jgi:uncharacterized membrane protein YesL
MRLLDSSLYWWVNRLSSYLLLSGLWLLCSSLLLTLFPATVAMFAVFRAWQENPDEAFYLPFLTRLRTHFGGDLVLGLVWLFLAALLLLNAALLPRLPPPARPPAFALLALAAVLYIAASVFLVPLRVRTSLGLWASVRAALILGMTQLGTTALSVLALALAGVAFWFFPPSLLVSGVAVGHLSFRLCDRRLKRLFT